MRSLVTTTLFCWAFASAMPAARAHDHESTEQLGRVSFSTSCKPAVQPEFDRGVALMHSFQFGPAIAAFGKILETDPDCAIAHWGIALSSWGNPFAGFKSPTQIEQGLRAVEQGRSKPARTERERAYLDAVAHLYVDSARIDQPTRILDYEKSMAALSAAYPDDIEAAIFHALALAAAADPSDKTYARQLEAGAILEKLFVKYPDHPGLAHYIIHAYDEPALASRAAEAARRYGKIAPSTPHALHMPSHTFTRLGDWQSSIDTNGLSVAAAKAAHQPADVLHASDYMVYAYLQTGQDDAAKRLVDASAQTFLAFDPAHATGAAPASAAFFARAAIPARYCLERSSWPDAARLEVHPSPFPYVDAITIFTRGVGAAHLKDASAVREAIGSLQKIRDGLIRTKDEYWANQVDIERQQLAAMLASVEGRNAEAVTGLRAAADAEDKTETASVTPGPLKPAREMLAELLLQTNRPSEALTQFEASLKKQPNRFRSLYGAATAARLSGDREKTHSYFQQLLGMAQHADTPGRRELSEARSAARDR